MHFHSQSSKLCSPPFLVGREERGAAGMSVAGPRLQLVNRLAVPKGAHSSCPVAGAGLVCGSCMYVFVICVPIGMRRLIDIWRAKELLLFKGRRLFSGYFLIRMSTCSGCIKLCRAQREIREGSGTVLPGPDNGWGLRRCLFQTHGLDWFGYRLLWIFHFPGFCLRSTSIYLSFSLTREYFL